MAKRPTSAGIAREAAWIGTLAKPDAKPKAKRGNPERTISVAVIRWLRLVLPVGSVVAAISNSEHAKSADPKARARFHAARKAAGQVWGMPDAIAICPDGKCWFFEFKTASGIVSELQSALHTRLASMGHTLVVCASIEDARGGLLRAGVPLREAAGQLATTARVRVAKPRARLLNDVVPL